MPSGSYSLQFQVAWQNAAGTTLRTDRWILGGGLFARLIYLFSIRPHEQANDWGEHIYYIKFIADRGVLPKWYECYECTHPPLFHSLGAAFLRLAIGIS